VTFAESEPVHSRIAIAIPCFNEAAAIASVISQFRAALPDSDLVVFDNNSTDGTGAIAASLGVRVVAVPDQGKGHAVQAAYRLLRDYDVVVLTDGDSTYPAAAVPELIAPVLSGDADLVVGAPGDGWRVAMGTLTFERGVSTLGQQIVYARELDGVAELAKRTGAADDPLIRERLTRSWAGLRAMRSYALATMDVEQPGQDNVSKLLWANWHRELGEIAMDVQGKAGLVLDSGDFDEWQRLYLFTRADTIYGGSNEIQRNIIAERVLGLPREAR